MARWADFEVFRVRYDLPGTTITELEVRSDRGDDFSEPRWVTRHGVVKDMERGMTYVTILSNGGKLYRGEPVRLMSFRGIQYSEATAKLRAATTSGHCLNTDSYHCRPARHRANA